MNIETNINANIHIICDDKHIQDKDVYKKVLQEYVDKVIALRNGIRNQLSNLSGDEAYVIAFEELRASKDYNQLQTVIDNDRS